MKACPICKNAYEDWVEFCFQDGAPLVAQAGGAKPAAPRVATLESAPSLPSDVMDSPVPEFGAFDAPEPTLIRMAKLQAAKGAPPSPIAAPTASTVSAYDAPSARPSRGEDLPSARSLAAPAAPPTAPWGEVAPSATEEALRADARSAEAPAPPPAAAVVRRPAPEPERDPTVEPTAVVPTTPAAADEFEFPRPDEDSRATVPMYTPQPEPPVRAAAKPAAARPPKERERDRERDRERGGAVGAPAAAGIGIAMIAAIGLGAVLLVGGGYFFWQSQKKAPEPVVDATPAPPPKEIKPPPVEPPPVEPPPEVIPPPVEPPPEVVPPPVEPPPVVTPPVKPVTPPVAPVTPPVKPVVPPVAPPVKPVTPPVKPVTAPVTPTTSPSDNPWGSTETISTGKLTITSDPPGGQVTIDGAVKGAAPVTVDVAYGKHKVKVTLAGHKAETSDVNINVQQMSVPFRLAAEVSSGIVNVFGPTDGSVFIDGNDLGPLPVSLQVTEGVHTFKLMQGDGKSCQTTRDVRFTDGARPVKVSLGACE